MICGTRHLRTPQSSAGTQIQEHADADQPSPWAPLHNPIYRNLFIASFISNIGTWMQSVAAQWFAAEHFRCGDMAGVGDRSFFAAVARHLSFR